MSELPGAKARGTIITPFPDDKQWHRAAVEWWVWLASSPRSAEPSSAVEIPEIPGLVPSSVSDDYPYARAANGLTLHAAQDELTVTASESGWAWLRVPWDPYWQSTSGTPVHKGGPGHLVVWAERGTTKLRWSVPGAVDAAAAAATGGAALVTATLAVVNRRRGWKLEPGRARPAAAAFSVFADTVDAWTQATVERLRRWCRSIFSPASRGGRSKEPDIGCNRRDGR